MHSHSLPGKSSLLRAGQVAGSVVDDASLAFAGSAAVAERCDFVEFRADALSPAPERLTAAMQSCPVPALLTVRSHTEGGLAALSLEDRQDLFQRLLPCAQLVDVEIAHLTALSGIVGAARQSGVVVVASFHDFHGTPDRSVLEDLAAQAMAGGADAVKFATTLHDSADLATLAALQESSPTPMATMGMGPLGRVSRLLLASLGSVLNYGYLDQPTIHGQWPARRLRELIQELKGE
jgi:3-dehydroquinate dehydratase-1